MPETTENYHRIPISDGHGGHEIKTITVSEGEGIKALYCTDCKEIVTYLFDVDKWTMGEAQEWVEDHKSYGDIMGKRLDMRTKQVIGSKVRFKSYGTFLPKGAGEDGSDNMLVRGYFTDDKMDEVEDIITKEATVDAVERWRQWGNIRTMHSNPSGRIEKIGEADGLAWNEVVTVPVEKTTRELIEGGVLKAYSVGIIPREYELNESALEEMGDDVDPWFLPLIIHSYDMVEISYVDHPANYAAAIQEVGSPKHKGMSHRNVIFKNSEIVGDIVNMEKDTEGAVVDEVVDDVVAEEEVADSAQPGEETGVEVVKEEEDTETVDVESEEEKDDVAEEEEVVEKAEESEFDVALAVGELKESLGGIEARVSGLAESLDGLADRVVERFIDAMSAETPGSDDVSDKGVEVEDEKSFDEDAFVEKVVDKVLAGLAEVIVPTAVRSARVMVDDDGEEVEPESNEDKTKRYLEMTPDERRARMKEALAQSITKDK